MNRRVILSVSLAVLGASFLVLAPTVEAVGAPTSAWWSRAATTTPTDEVPAGLPVAPATPDTVPIGATVPEGQLLVEGSPDGATAIAAVRWELAEGESSPSITLPVGETSTVNPQSVVLACKAATPWTPPEAVPGKWDTKPLVDGTRCVNGVIAEDLSTITFGVQPILSGATLDVVFVAGEDPNLSPPAGVPEPPANIDGSAFRLVFDAPTAESVKVVPGSGFSPGEGDRFITPTTSATPDFGTTDTPPDTSSAPVDTSPAFEAPEEAASPALPPEDLAPSVPDVADAVPAANTAGPANRTIGFILLALSALVAGWAYMTSDPSAAGTVGLGRFAAPAAAGAAPLAGGPGAQGTVGGLSRFARPRSTPPTRLS